MGQFAIGSVVLAVFPFSDLSGRKLRPTLVIGHGEFGDLILCQITSKAYSSKLAVEVVAEDFSEGNLPVKSYVRPDKIFTTDPTLIERSVGTLGADILQTILDQIVFLFSGG